MNSKSFGTVLAVLSAFGLAAMVGPSVARAADLTIGTNIGNVPWEFEDAEGNFVGFEIDLATIVAERLGKTVEFVNIPFTGLFPAVQSGRIDIAMSSITITAKRLESVAFAQPYYDSDQSLTVLAGSGITSVEDMAGKVVGVDTSSTGDIWASAHQEEYGFAEIRRYEGLQPAMLDLQAGRLDGYVSDIPALLYYTKDKPNLEVAERIVTGEQYSFMFAKDSPLVEEVNAVFTVLKGEGVIAELHEKWFGSTPEDSTSTVKVLDIPKL